MRLRAKRETQSESEREKNDTLHGSSGVSGGALRNSRAKKQTKLNRKTAFGALQKAKDAITALIATLSLSFSFSFSSIYTARTPYVTVLYIRCKVCGFFAIFLLTFFT